MTLCSLLGGFLHFFLYHYNAQRNNSDTFVGPSASIRVESQSDVGSLTAPRETDALSIRLSIIRMSNVVEYAGARSRRHNYMIRGFVIIIYRFTASKRAFSNCHRIVGRTDMVTKTFCHHVQEFLFFLFFLFFLLLFEE